MSVKSIASEGFREYMQLAAKVGGFEYARDGDIARFCSDLPHRSFNYVWSLDNEDPEFTKKLDAVMQTFADKHIPFFLACAQSQGADIEDEELLARGFEYLGPIKCMLRDLDDLPKMPALPDLRIHEARSLQEFEEWYEFAEEIFDIPAHISRDYLGKLFHQGSPFQAFIAYMEGQVVGISFLLLGEGVAGNYYGGVKESHRNRGILTSLAITRMQYAKDRGYKKIVAQCLESSAGAYERMGFVEEPTSMAFYRKSF